MFIGHGVTFVNDKTPRATTDTGDPQGAEDWDAATGRRRASCEHRLGGARARGVRIGADALAGAGAVVTKDVAPGAVVVGVPARARQEPRTNVPRAIGSDAAE